MAVFYGAKGAVAIGNFEPWTTAADNNLTKWTMEVSSELFDVTTMTTAAAPHFKSFAGGHVEWSGTIEMFMDDHSTTGIPHMNTTSADLGFGATAGSLVCTDGAGNTYTGSIHLENFTIEDDREDYVTLNCNYRGTGVLVIAGV